MKAPRMKRIALLLAVLSVLTAAAFSEPDYASQHFEVYDRAGAEYAYLRAVAEALEEALSTLSGRGVSLAPPCYGSRYAVYVARLPGNELGFTSWRFRVSERGEVTGACVLSLNISSNLRGELLRLAAHHELVHVAQASYIRDASIVYARPWYVEASAEGFATALTNVCNWIPYYFSYGLYAHNPYSFSGADSRCYALGAFYYWIVAAGRSTLEEALRGSFSSSAVNPWVNEAYASFLLAITRGVALCGRVYEPAFVRVYLPVGAWNTSAVISGLSAAYYMVNLPAPGPVLITARGNVRSNLALGKSFETQNTTLLLALVNPSLDPATVDLTVHYNPPLEVKVVRGAYDGWGRRLTLTLRVLYAGQPINGLVEINGSLVEASSGYATIQLDGAAWGAYALRVSHSGRAAYARVAVVKPSLSLVTSDTLYLSLTGRGRVEARLSNGGDVGVMVEVRLEAPPFIESSISRVEIPPGSTTVHVPFRVIAAPFESVCRLSVCFGPNDCANSSLSVVPVNITIASAAYDSLTNTSTLRALAPPLAGTLVATVSGLSGVAWFAFSTYYVGGVAVSLPPPSVNLTAKPELVAPGWVLLRVNSTAGIVGGCPAYPVSYEVVAAVNGTPLGKVAYSCGERASLTALVNLTYRGAGLTLGGPFARPISIEVPRPSLGASLLDWLIEDSGSSVKVAVEVRGPCRFLVLGREVSNATLLVERRLGGGAKEVTIDAGFEVLKLEMPRVELRLLTPSIVLASQPVEAELLLSTSARVNSTVAILLNGREVMRISVTKGYEPLLRVPLALHPAEPGVYNVTATSWFASATAKLSYVRVRRLALEAPRLALVGGRAEALVILGLEPPVPLPVNVTIESCGPGLALSVPANSTFPLSSDEVCTARVEAEFLNYTASASVQWDKLILTFERTLGLFRGALLVPNGTLRPVALFSNGSAAPAEALVEESRVYAASKPGGYVLKVRAELWGLRNESLLRIYAVPEDLYNGAVELLAELGSPPNLEQSLTSAIVSGEWERVEEFVETYRAAKRASRDPLAALAKALLEQWAAGGGDLLLAAAISLLEHRLLIYAALASALALLLARRRAAKASRTTRPARDGATSQKLSDTERTDTSGSGAEGSSNP